MVHHNLCARNLPSKSVYCLLNAEDWPRSWSGFGWVKFVASSNLSFAKLLIWLLADDPDGPALPTRSNEEFRPFIRRLPEFKFWYAITKSTTIALFCTFFEVFNVPVFWPILVMYFITLFCITMKRQIRVWWMTLETKNDDSYRSYVFSFFAAYD